jgi:hypothetical protein
MVERPDYKSVRRSDNLSTGATPGGQLGDLTLPRIRLTLPEAVRRTMGNSFRYGEVSG